MCGKFTRMASWAGVVAFSQPLTRDRMEDSGNDKVVGLRVGDHIPVIVCDADLPERIEISMQWGFPHKTKRLDPIHCRSETIDSRPTFAPLFHEGQRELVVVRTFNEGEEVGKKMCNMKSIRRTIRHWRSRCCGRNFSKATRIC